MRTRGVVSLFCVGVTLVGTGSCIIIPPVVFAGLPVETNVAFTNFSLEHYATLGIRSHGSRDSTFTRLPLLAPGATFRAAFLDMVGEACPQSLDLRLWVYERENAEVPIGLDDDEAVDAVPIAAGEILDVPACNVLPLETYTIVNWETDDPAVARVKIAQGTPIEDAIDNNAKFRGIDNTWEFRGVAGDLSDDDAPALLAPAELSGSVLLANGAGVEGVGVLVRTRFRVRLDDDDAGNDPDSGFGDPIAFTTTDEDGAFSFDRPAGVYRVEFFSDDFAFRPDYIIVESPIATIRVVAEAL